MPVITRLLPAVPLLATLAACGWQGPPLAGQPGLQWQVISFYDGRAMENHASCPTPHLRSIIATRVVEETPERVVMALRYYWVDDQVQYTVNGGQVSCQDWGERTFTFARASDGTLTVVAMSGPQKRA